MIRILAGATAVLAIGLGVQTARLDGALKTLKLEKAATAAAVLAQKNPETGKLWKVEAGAYKAALAAVPDRLKAAADQEDARREGALTAAQRLSQDLRIRLDRNATKLAIAQEESRRASLANDAAVCLGPDSVRRLADVR